MESFSEKAFEAAQQCNDMKRYQQQTISHSFCAYLHSFFLKQGKTLTTVSTKSLS